MSRQYVHRRTGAKCQVAIPVAMQKRLGFRPNAEVLIIERKDSITIKPADDVIERFYGIFKDKLPPWEQIKKELRREEREHERKKLGL